MWLAMAATALLLVAPVTAQQNTADIVGTVTDSTGAIIPNATVTETNLGTGISQTVATGSSGDYTFTLLQVGTYSIKVEANGFKVFSAPSITLAAGDRARVNAAMELGPTTETIEVAATTPALQTDSSQVSSLITAQATQNLPLNGRNIISLVQIQPGVTAGLPNAMSSGTRPDDRRLASNYSANGQTDELNNNLIDGMDNNERFIGTIGVRPSIDAIQEVRILTGLYTAEVGRSVGGVVDLITKSGTNNFHGSLFEFLRNDVLDANNWLPPGSAKLPKAELVQNQFGGSLGGPIVKDKTFFFFDYEGFRQVKGITSTSTVPTLFEENNPGNFTDIGGPIIANPNPIGLAYFKLFPKPTNAQLVNNFNFNSGRTQYTNDFDIRVDQHFNSANSFFARYSFNNVNTFTPSNFPDVNGINPGTGPFGAFPGPAKERQQALGLEYVHVFRPDLLLQLRAGFLRSYIASLPLNYGENVANTYLGFPCTNTVCINTSDPVTSGLPSVNFNNGGYSALGDDAFVPLTTIDNTFQYSGTVVWTRGPHSIKIGAALIRRQLFPTQSPYPRGNLTVSNFVFAGSSLPDLLTGEIANVNRQNTVVQASLRSWEPSTFIQDDWHVNRVLTLNLGVRYDIFTPYTAQNQAFSNYNPAINLLVSPSLPGIQHSSNTADVRTDYYDIAPRVGFSATVAHGLVMRGGFGVSFFPGNYASGAVMRNAPFNFGFTCGAATFNTIPCTGSFTNPAFPTNAYFLDGSLPIPVLNIALATDPTTYNTVNSTAFNLKTAYIEQYSFQIQKEFGGNVFTIGYLGNRGEKLTTQQNVNQLPFPVTAGGTFPIPSLPNLSLNERLTGGISRYNALQLQFERRLKAGLTASANYTYSHNLTNTQVQDEGQPVGNCEGPCHVSNGAGGFVVDNSWHQYDYGNADLDTRHRVSVQFNYALPFAKGMTGVGGMLLGGWSINAIYSYSSGNPFTVQNPDGSISGINLGNDRPNMLRNAKISNASASEWFNTAVFVPQNAGTLGDQHRNQVYGPPMNDLDFSVFKDFPIRESIHLQFRTEVFNLTNTPALGQPNATRAAGFGTITSIAPNSNMREIQFALKLLF
jgi:hypothetical protein